MAGPRRARRRPRGLPVHRADQRVRVFGPSSYWPSPSSPGSASSLVPSPPPSLPTEARPATWRRPRVPHHRPVAPDPQRHRRARRDGPLPRGIIVRLPGRRMRWSARVRLEPPAARPRHEPPGPKDWPGCSRTMALTPGETVLSARGLRVAYGHVVAVRDVSLEKPGSAGRHRAWRRRAEPHRRVERLRGNPGSVELREARTGPRRRRPCPARPGAVQGLEQLDNLGATGRTSPSPALDSRSRLAYA